MMDKNADVIKRSNKTIHYRQYTTTFVNKSNIFGFAYQNYHMQYLHMCVHLIFCSCLQVTVCSLAHSNNSAGDVGLLKDC